MPRKNKTYRLLSLINSSTLLLQQILFPFWFIFTPTPALAKADQVFSFEFSKHNNSFEVTAPSVAEVSYGLYYVHDDQVNEAITGKFVDQTEIKAGTCSEGGTCVDHTVKRGVFKYRSATHTGGLTFVVVNDKVEILTEYEIDELELTPEEQAWLSGTDVSPPSSPVKYPDPTPTPIPSLTSEPAPMNVMLAAAQTTPITVDSNKCMADLYGSKLNCTANDVSIANVSNIEVLDSCDYPGDDLTFTATWDVKSTATERYNVGLYFASGGQTSALNGSCSISSLPNSPVPPWYDFDQNICGDISSAAMVHPVITMTVKCLDPDGDNILNLPYCTSWEQNSSACSGPLSTIPGAPSKCNCDDGFEVPITVPHSAQIEVVKNLVPDLDPGRFNLQIDGVDKATNLGDGTTGKVVVGAGTSQVPGAIHTVSETAYGLTDLSLYNSSISCVDRGKTTFDGGPALHQTGIGPINVHVDKDDDIVCTITNSTKIGSLVVQKTTLPSGNQTLFTINATGSGTISGSTTGTVSDDQDYSYQVTAGNYWVTETVPTGWTKTVDSCQNVAVGAGQTVYCQLTNTKQATLTLNKTVVNDNGGTATATNFQAMIDGVNVSWGIPIVVSDGTHTASETNLAGYQASNWSGNCAANGSITLAPGENKVCAITNDDIAPSLTLIKTVDNNNGGTATASAWTLSASGPTPISGAGGVVSDSSFKAGTYTLSESGPTGYTAGSWNCTGVTNTGNSITLGLGQSASCTINNDDQPAKLIVKKVLIKDNGGNEVATDFGFSVNGGNSVSFEADGENVMTVNAGTYSVTEPAVAGYSTSYDNCSNLVIPNGGSATCTITNDDIAPSIQLTKNVINDNGGTAGVNDFGLSIGGTLVSSGQQLAVEANKEYSINEVGLVGYEFYSISGNEKCPQVLGGTANLNENEHIACTITNKDIAPKLKLVKQVINDNGGDASASAWTLTATGDRGFSDNGYTGIFHNVKANVSYDLSESFVPGYSTTGLWSCNGGRASGNTVLLAPGDVVTCTISNDDVAPKLTVVKTVVNDNGGNKTVADFKLYVDGDQVNSGVKNSYVSNHLYTLTEGNLTGYSASTWGGNCTADGKITLNPGDDKTCTITNDDIAPSLALIKTVTNNFGGTASASAWTLAANGPSSISGAGGAISDSSFKAGTYALSETGLSGYTAGNWVCTGITNTGNSITLELGQAARCTINNSDQPAKLIVKKVLIKNNGGNEAVTDFGFRVNGGQLITFEADGENELIVNAGTYSVIEPTVAGYSTSYDNCSNLVIPNGGTATCTITNDDIAPTITLVKEVVGDNGGNAGANDFGLTIGDTPVTSGQVLSVMANQDYALDEAGSAGYEFRSITGDGCPTTLGGTVNLAEDEHLVCTITNDDITPTLTVIKNVVNDNGGTLGVNDFEIKLGDDLLTFGDASVSGTTATYTATPTVAANTPYTLSERDVPGYDEGTWNCVDTADGQAVALPLLLDEGQNVKCTITNDDVAPTLTLVKEVINDDGGTATASSFQAKIDNTNVPWGVTQTVAAGTYTVSETTLTGYTPSGWGGDCAANGTITLNPGDDKTCTITNNDVAPQLRLVKQVINDNGGNASASAWTLTAAGVGGFSDNGETGGFHPVKANETYGLRESSLPGYNPSWWKCTGGRASGNTVLLAPGDVVTCTITNDDVAPKLTVVKTVINDNGGNKTVTDFKLYVNGDQVTSGVKNTYTANQLYTLTEDNLTGYAPSAWGGDCTADGTITLNPGDDKTCTITNDDIAPTLTLIKTLDNREVGTATSSAWTLQAQVAGDYLSKISGPGPIVGPTTVTANRDYVLSEYGGPTGYTASAWSCDGGEVSTNFVGDTQVKLALATNVTCSITNTRDTGSITIIKNTVGGDDSFSFDSNFGVDSIATVGNSGSATISGLGTGHEYAISEIPLDGWDLNNAVCDRGTPEAIEVAKDVITTCTFTNTKRGLVSVFKFEDVNSNGTKDSGESLLPGWEVSLGQASQITDATGSARFSLVPGDYLLSETMQSGWKQTGMYCNQAGVKITREGEAYGHHGQCGGWNSCGDAATCAQWACEVKGYSQLVSYGEQKPCTEFASCNLFYSKGNVQMNWGNWCEVMGVTDIVCANGVGAGDEGSEVQFNADSQTVTVEAGDVGSCYVGNFKKGDVTVWKYEDTDGVLGRSSGEQWLGSPSFTFRLYRSTGSGWQWLGEQGTNSEGKAEFNDLLDATGSYYVCEVKKDGWQEMRSVTNPANNQSGAIDEYPVCEQVTVNSSGYGAVVEFGNGKLSDIHGYKWEDEDGNGEVSGSEQLMPGWTINLYRWDGEDYNDGEPVQTMATADSASGHLGWYWFEDLIPGQYKICEVSQSGWNQTFPINEDDNCHTVFLPEGGSNGFNFPEMQNYINGPVYAFGNQYVRPSLTIEKSNNRWPQVLAAKDEIGFTIVIRALNNIVYNVKVKDLLPLDIEYKSGSYRAESDLNGVLTITPPTYASPGTWSLGTMKKGESITLTYTGIVKNGTDPGTYKDIAWAEGSVEEDGDDVILATAVNPGYLDNTFVGTQIRVDRSPSADVNVIEEKQQGKVLGATTLPATGANEIWIIISAGLVGIGTGLWLAGGKKRGKHA